MASRQGVGQTVKVNDHFTIRSIHSNQRGGLFSGRYKYYICENDEHFYSTRDQPLEAFDRFCNTVEKIRIKGETIVRLSTTSKSLSNNSKSKRVHVHNFMIRESNQKFHSEDCNIYNSYKKFQRQKSKYVNPEHEDMDWE